MFITVTCIYIHIYRRCCMNKCWEEWLLLFVCYLQLEGEIECFSEEKYINRFNITVIEVICCILTHWLNYFSKYSFFCCFDLFQLAVFFSITQLPPKFHVLYLLVFVHFVRNIHVIFEKNDQLFCHDSDLRLLLANVKHCFF